MGKKWTEYETKYLIENYGKILIKEICLNLSRPYGQVIHKARKLGMKSNLRYINNRSEAIKTIAKIERKGYCLAGKYKNNSTKTKFKCHCGNVFVCVPQNILTNNVSSCGCKKGFTQRKGTDYVSLSYFNRALYGAKIRLLDFSVSIQYINDLFVKQNFRCALSGIKLTSGYKVEQTASLDRIDNTKGYIDGNVQWIHKDINLMKHIMDQELFINYCKQIGEFNAYKSKLPD